MTERSNSTISGVGSTSASDKRSGVLPLARSRSRDLSDERSLSAHERSMSRTGVR